MWRRCLARAGIDVAFSQGFNPHPKMSLPLPRSVGVEGDQELLRVSLCRDIDAGETITLLSQELPEGCCVQNIEIVEKKTACRPLSVLYVLSPQTAWWQTPSASLLEQHQQAIASAFSCVVHRYNPKHTTGRTVDIGGYFQKLKWDQQNIYVRCRFSPEGTVRVEEILTRLGLNRGDLACPVLRTAIEWQMQ